MKISKGQGSMDVRKTEEVERKLKFGTTNEAYRITKRNFQDYKLKSRNIRSEDGNVKVLTLSFILEMAT